MLVLVGAWEASHWVAIFAATGLILGACYMLWLYRRVVFGRAGQARGADFCAADHSGSVVRGISIYLAGCDGLFGFRYYGAGRNRAICPDSDALVG